MSDVSRSTQRSGFDIEVRVNLLETDVDGIHDVVRTLRTELEASERAQEERYNKIMARINAILVAFTTLLVTVGANIVFSILSNGSTP